MLDYPDGTSVQVGIMDFVPDTTFSVSKIHFV